MKSIQLTRHFFSHAESLEYGSPQRKRYNRNIDVLEGVSAVTPNQHKCAKDPIISLVPKYSSVDSTIQRLEPGELLSGP